MVRARTGGHGHGMTQGSRSSARFGLPIALFGLGVGLLIAEQNAGIAWGIILGAFALAAMWAGDAASDQRSIPRDSRESQPYDHANPRVLQRRGRPHVDASQRSAPCAGWCTAAAIARDLTLADDNARAMTGAELESLDNDRLVESGAPDVGLPARVARGQAADRRGAPA